MSAATAEAAPRTTGKQWTVLTVLTFVYVINFLDRQLLGFLAKPIKDSLQITDGQLGLIGGFYFACFYCFIAIPVGWFADRTNRVQVLSIACAVWSAATAACGLAGNYAQLVAARMMVGELSRLLDEDIRGTRPVRATRHGRCAEGAMLVASLLDPQQRACTVLHSYQCSGHRR